MAHWKKSFPSRFLQVSDLDSGPLTLTIKDVAAENVGSTDDAELKLTVGFHEPGMKRLVCNLTRAEAIAELAGSDDTDRWPNTRITVVRGTTRYQGKKVACLLVETPTTNALTTNTPTLTTNTPADHADDESAGF